MDLLAGFSVLNCIYLSLVIVGVLYGLFLLIAGGLHEISLPDIDLDIGDVDLGGLHLPDMPIHLDIDSVPSFDHGEVGVPSLSPVTIASFITAFGAFGLIATFLFNVPEKTSLLWAGLGALVVAAIAHFAFGYFLIAPQGSSEITVRDIVGKTGEVITPIPATGTGKIALVARGTRVTLGARSTTGAPIPRGTLVVVEDMVGVIALVRPRAAP